MERELGQYGNHVYSEQDTLAHFKVANEIFDFHRKKLEPRVFAWQQHSRCHCVSFVMYIAGA